MISPKTLAKQTSRIIPISLEISLRPSAFLARLGLIDVSELVQRVISNNLYQLMRIL